MTKKNLTSIFIFGFIFVLICGKPFDCINIASKVYAAPKTKIYYQGMLSGKAMIKVNGRSVKLTPGQTSKGVKLLSVDLESVVIEVEGKSYRYEKYSNHGTFLAKADAEEIILEFEPDFNAYWVFANIKGKGVFCIIDTGATDIVMNEDAAKALNIKPSKEEIEISTASRTETAYRVTLDNISIDYIELQNIPAIITKSKYPPYLLLGMSFLRHIEFSQKNDKMILKYTPR